MGEQFGFQAGNCGFQAQMNCHSLIPNESFQPFLHLLLSHFFCSFRSSRTSICCSVGKQCRSSAGKQKLLFSRHTFQTFGNARSYFSRKRSFSSEKGREFISSLDLPKGGSSAAHGQRGGIHPKQQERLHSKSNRKFPFKGEKLDASRKHPLNFSTQLPDPHFCSEISENWVVLPLSLFPLFHGISGWFGLEWILRII